MYKVLLTDNPDTVCLDVFARYEEIEATIVGTLETERLIELISGYDAVIVRSPTRITSEIIAAAPRLRFIGRAGAGYDNIDIDAASRHGIVVMNAPTGNIITTAEHTIGLILSVVRNIPHAHRSLTAGEWKRSAFRGRELFGKTAGIIGLGRVGKEVAKRLCAFSMRVIAADPYVRGMDAASIGVSMVDLPALLKESDIITIHAPLNQETRSLISSREFDQMRNGVFLINCARGGIVDEVALLRALESGRVAATAADVFETEPPYGSPLLNHPGSVFTPHIGAATDEARRRIALEIAENISEALVNGVLRSAINPPPE
jgi:D-3-phosphoglycerate dehydrogenase